MSKTHWKQLMNINYIGAYWLDDGQDKTVVMDTVAQEVVKGTGGKEEPCMVARLKGEKKKFIINRTNAKTIERLYGKHIEDWRGKPITLFASTTRLAGETVECLRIRPAAPQQGGQPISQERFDSAVAAIRSGQYKAETLRSRFTLTQQQKVALDRALKEMAAADIPEPVGAPENFGHA